MVGQSPGANMFCLEKPCLEGGLVLSFLELSSIICLWSAVISATGPPLLLACALRKEHWRFLPLWRHWLQDPGHRPAIPKHDLFGTATFAIQIGVINGGSMSVAACIPVFLPVPWCVWDKMDES
ncbi:unnamed protein product [Durusdinium trenchii]|uniref:Uncharacterized protein n=1 Tax=Durusdinium trenchii TaxID=1381693 RepID=A0ABP0S5X7_9DINO